jgi:hypothetical protein
MNLFKASRQWATRPDDERFATLEDLITSTRAYADSSAEAITKYSDLRVRTPDYVDPADVASAEIELVGKTGQPARFSHWGFGQFAARLGAPAAYLRELPAVLATKNLEHGLAKQRLEEPDATAKMLVHRNGSLMVRAFTGEGYARIWNHEVGERLLPLVANGWKIPPAYDNGDRPSGLYASDHDMFAFLVNDDRRISEPGNPDGLGRGVFIENSEVGASSLRVTRFLYRYVCGNHIVWDVKDVLELSIRHTGDIDTKARAFFATIKQYADSSASDEEAQIQRAYTYKIGDTKDEVLDAIFGKSILSRKQTAKAYELAEKAENLDPRTAWGLAQGVTRMSQEIPFADRRTELDRAAGKILRMAF